MLRTVIMYHRFGPYHHSRLRALAKIVDVAGIELSAVDETYAWDRVERGSTFRHMTLFSARDVTQEGGVEIRARVRRALDSMQPSVVAVPGWSSRAALAALEWCGQHRIPRVLMSDSTFEARPRWWWKERIKQAIVRTCQSALVAGKLHSDYLERLGMCRDHIFVGYDVVDNDYFAQGARRARLEQSSVRRQLQLPDHYFLTSSRFIQVKNLDRLLAAFALYRRRTGRNCWSLVVLGDGELKTELMQLCRDLEISDVVFMPGFKQYNELPAYYGLASAFVLASTSETWGLVVNEAMASGIPVLVSNRCGCAPDLVTEGVNGFTFSPYDVEELADRMTQMAQGEVDLRQMGEASRRIMMDWTPNTFALNMSRALAAAVSAGNYRMRMQDRILLLGLSQRFRES